MNVDGALEAARAHAVPSEVLADLARAVERSAATGGRAHSTVRAYQSALRQAKAWCDARGVDSSALTDRQSAELLAAAARGGVPGWPKPVGMSRLRILVSALASAYAARNLPTPVGELCGSLLRDLSRTRPAPRVTYALTPADLVRAVQWAENHGAWWLPGVLCVGFGGALRAGELGQCNTAEGRTLVIRQGKRGPRRVHLIPARQRGLCPVRWAACLAPHGLPSVRGISLALRQCFDAVGLHQATAHSLRHGWATEAARRGLSLSTIALHLGVKDSRTASFYVGRAALAGAPSLV